MDENHGRWILGGVTWMRNGRWMGGVSKFLHSLVESQLHFPSTLT